MYFLVAGTILFFATHFYAVFRSREPARNVQATMGKNKFMGLFSLISLLGFVLVIWGYGLSRPSALIFSPPLWGPHVTMAFMLPALVLLAAAYSPRGYIKDKTKHPMFIAMILWSAGHLLANGELNSLILFGSFLAFALIGFFVAWRRPESVKPVSIIGDVIAVIIGVATYYFFVTKLHEYLIGTPISPGFP